MPTRETVMQALFALLSTAAPFETKSRRIVLTPDLTPEIPAAQPALYMQEGDELTTYAGRGIPAHRVWSVDALIYCQLPGAGTPSGMDGTTPSVSVLNPLLDAIEAVLAPPPSSDTQTLGGLVSHCWIEGATVKVTGDINPNGQCMAAIPIKILVP